ncbi:MAG: Ig-like domain-containing protein, partial [Clostridia bacterium]|nr:Ig-like domain-containing protein [Clostridia bacterium]
MADITAEPMELKVNGPTGTINTVFAPAEASYNTFDWLKFESDNTDVATVDNKGVVTPGVAGTANITITATNGTETTADDKTTVCVVTVRYVNISGVTLDHETLGLTYNGPSDTLKATVLEDDASDKTIVWSSSDENIVKVNQKGVVTPVNLGTATITVTATNGTPDDTSDDKTATCTVNVTVLDIEKITLNKESMELAANGNSEKLSYTTVPEYTSYRYADDVVWTSDNPAVATVDQDGTVRGIWEGTATITATAINGTPDDPSDDKTATCVVTVTQVHVSEAQLDQTDIDVNLYRKPVVLTGTLGPDNASYKTYKWVSDNPEIATVDQYGRVSPVSVGKTTIRYIATNGSEDTSDDKEATCAVNVFIPNEISYYVYDAQSKTLVNEKTTAYSPVYADDYSWGAIGTDKWYYVDSDITINNSYYNRLTVNGNVHLVIADGVTLNVLNEIEIKSGSSLSVYGTSLDDTIKLITPTISGNGDLTIHSGSVTVSAPSGKDAITANTVTVNGGKLSAKGDNEFHGTSGIVCTAFVINGGYVNAQGGTWDPGKGIAASETITVNGGTLDVSAQFVAYTGKLTVREDYIMVVSGNGFRDNTRIDVTKIEEATRVFQVARAHIGVPSDVTGVTLDKASVELALGVDHVNLIPTVAPYDSRDNVTWSSSDESVATVDRNGEVVPVGVGNAVITATATNGTEDTSDDKTTTCEVTVYSKDGTSYLKYDSETRSFTEEYATNYRTISKDLREWRSEYDWDDERYNDPVWLYADQDVTYEQYDDINVYGNIHLIIKDGVTITIPNHIYVGSGSLTIYAQSQDEATMGKLIIKNETFSNAGIDIKYSDTRLTINGGYIETHGNEGGAGIGGGKYSDCESTIIINGGI